MAGAIKYPGPDFEAAGPDFEAAGPDFEAAEPDKDLGPGPDKDLGPGPDNDLGPDKDLCGLHAEAGQWLEEANGAGSTVIQRTTAKWPPRPCPRCSALRQRPTLMMVTPMIA